jgi:hypothetical protein
VACSVAVRRRLLRTAALSLSLSLVGAGGSPGRALAAPPARPALDRGAVERQIAELESTTAHGEPVAEPLGRARKALSRALAMERAGDARHAGQAVAAARAWLDVARDVVRLRHAESRALLAEQKQDEILTQLKRSRALLEESVARRGRAASVLAELERGAPPAQDSKPPAQDSKPPAQDAKPPAQDTKPSPAKGGAAR